jgi:hypothetical protein
MPITPDAANGEQPRVEEEHRTQFTDVRAIDPESGETWTRFMDTNKVQRYLAAQGIEVAVQTLTHWRSAGTGPVWRFRGQKPITTKDEVDRFIESKMLSDTSPLVGKHRRKAPRKRQSAKRRN